MNYKNIYLIDRKSIRQEAMEFLIIGSKYGKIFNLIGIIFVISSFISMNNNPSNNIYFFAALLLFVMNIVRIYKKAVNYSKRLEDKTLKRVITIDESVVSEKLYESEKIIKDASFPINEVAYVGKGFRHIFIVLSDDLLVIRKDSFSEGDGFSLCKDLISNKKTYTIYIEKSSKYRFQKICITVGTLLSVMLSFAFVRKIEVDEPVLPIFLKMIFSGIVLSTWISFAITFYVQWYAKQKNMMKIFSIVLFPVSFFVFMCIGLIKAVPYIVEKNT